MNPFAYAIDYDAEIAVDRAVLATCDRDDVLCAMLPGMVAYTLHFDPHARSFYLCDFLGFCADLDFAATVAATAGVSLEDLVRATDPHDGVDEAWTLWRAFVAKYGHAPRGRHGAKESNRVYYCLCVNLPGTTKAVRKKAKADLARHTRNKAKYA